ncbi:MAG: metal ABC transporter permease [Pseudomonadota bacterium]
MIDELRSLFFHFPHALLAGVLIAAVCSMLGVFTVLKRVVFIGITLSEVAACGLAAAMVWQIHPFIGAGALTALAVAVLSYPFETVRLPRDAVLGVMFVGASAVSILLVSRSGFGLNEVKMLLYGDLILASREDLKMLLITLLPVLVYLPAFFRPTLYTFLDREAARLLGVRVVVWELLYFFALGLTVSAASKVAGSLLIFCYLVVMPAAALLLTRKIVRVMTLAVAGALVVTLVGIHGSFSRDLPTNQTVAAVACIWFLLAFFIAGLRKIFTRPAAHRQ